MVRKRRWDFQVRVETDRLEASWRNRRFVGLVLFTPRLYQAHHSIWGSYLTQGTRAEDRTQQVNRPAQAGGWYSVAGLEFGRISTSLFRFEPYPVNSDLAEFESLASACRI